MNSLQNNLVPLVPLVKGTNGTKSTNEHRYSLEKGSKKHHCPDCNKKTFVLYIDTETGNYLPEHYGRCDRESKCGYYQLPPLETLCYFVSIDSIRTITENAVLISQNGVEEVLPRKAILEQTETGIYVADYFLNDKANIRKTPLKITFDSNDRKYFADGNISFKPQQKKAIPKPTPAFFDFETFKQTLEPERYEQNIFIQNLFYGVKYPFEVEEVTRVIQLYRLGTVANGYRAGANTFPFIDINGNVRAIQVKQFDEANHTTGTDFLHSIIEKYHTRNNKPLPEWLEAYNKNETFVSCLFGEHLLSKYHNNPVALVEAPKTATYGTLYFGLPETPESLIWLAVYNKSSFSFDKLKVLQGRFVYVFPDLSKDGNTFKEWETKAKEYEARLPGTRFIFSDLLEQLAPERDKSKGNDLADYLIKQDWRLFRKRNIQEQPQPETELITSTPEIVRFYEPKKEVKAIAEKYDFEVLSTLSKNEEETTYRKRQTQNWSNELAELESYFASIELPTKPVKLNGSSTITDCKSFVNSHFTTIERNNGKPSFLPYLERLQQLKDVLSTNTSPEINLSDIALKVMPPESMKTAEDIIQAIMDNKKVNKERAMNGLKKLIEEDFLILNPINTGYYYLNGSTPF